MSLLHMTWASLRCTVSKLHCRRPVSNVCRFGQIKSLWRLFWLTFNKRAVSSPNWHFHPEQSPIQLHRHIALQTVPTGGQRCILRTVELFYSSFKKRMPLAVCVHGQLMERKGAVQGEWLAVLNKAGWWIKRGYFTWRHAGRKLSPVAMTTAHLPRPLWRKSCNSGVTAFSYSSPLGAHLFSSDSTGIFL